MFFLEGGGNYGFIPIQKEDTYGTNNIGAGTSLVRPAPVYASLANNKNAINMLILSWNVGSDNANSDKPRLFDGEPKGFQLADYYMARLYHQQKIWNKIISLVLL